MSPAEHEYTIWTINSNPPGPDHGPMDGDIREVLGRNLQVLRRRRALTQEKLRDAAKVSQQYLSELEAGKRNPSIRLVAKLAAALGVEPMELLRRHPPGEGEGPGA